MTGFILHYIRAHRLIKKNIGKHSFTLIKVLVRYLTIPILERFSASLKHLTEWVFLALEIKKIHFFKPVYIN